jgi:hypothetical protein
MLTSEVDHRVAVWAYRSQVVHRIHFVITGDSGEKAKMMDVNEPLRHVLIHGIEVGFNEHLWVVISRPVRLRLSASVAMCWGQDPCRRIEMRAFLPQDCS